MQSNDTRHRLIRLFTFLGGIYFFAYFVLPDEALGWLKDTYRFDIKGNHEHISNGFIVISAMALGLGLINLLNAHGSRLVFQKPGWINSLALLFGLFLMMAVTGASWFSGLSMASRVKELRTVSEFAARIVEDAQGKPDAQTPKPAVRPVSERTLLLADAADRALASVREHIASAPGAEAIPARDVLVQEIQTGLGQSEAALAAARKLSSDSLTEEGAAALKEVSFSINRLMGSYTVLLRLERERTIVQRGYHFLYSGLFTALGSAMFALLGVYIAAAAYRAFRIRTLESGLMMVAAVIVMLGQISFGRSLYEDLPAVRQWLLEVPSSAAFRAIRLGAAVAGLMLAIRMWLSIESKTFSNGKK